MVKIDQTLFRNHQIGFENYENWQLGAMLNQLDAILGQLEAILKQLGANLEPKKGGGAWLGGMRKTIDRV